VLLHCTAHYIDLTITGKSYAEFTAYCKKHSNQKIAATHRVCQHKQAEAREPGGGGGAAGARATPTLIEEGGAMPPNMGAVL